MTLCADNSRLSNESVPTGSWLGVSEETDGKGVCKACQQLALYRIDCECCVRLLETQMALGSASSGRLELGSKALQCAQWPCPWTLPLCCQAGMKRLKRPLWQARSSDTIHPTVKPYPQKCRALDQPLSEAKLLSFWPWWHLRALVQRCTIWGTTH